MGEMHEACCMHRRKSLRPHQRSVKNVTSHRPGPHKPRVMRLSLFQGCLLHPWSSKSDFDRRRSSRQSLQKHHFSKVALADTVDDPLEASPLRSKVALADSVEDPL